MKNKELLLNINFSKITSKVDTNLSKSETTNTLERMSPSLTVLKSLNKKTEKIKKECNSQISKGQIIEANSLKLRKDIFWFIDEIESKQRSKNLLDKKILEILSFRSQKYLNFKFEVN